MGIENPIDFVQHLYISLCNEVRAGSLRTILYNQQSYATPTVHRMRCKLCCSPRNSVLAYWPNLLCIVGVHVLYRGMVAAVLLWW